MTSLKMNCMVGWFMVAAPLCAHEFEGFESVQELARINFGYQSMALSDEALEALSPIYQRYLQFQFIMLVAHIGLIATLKKKHQLFGDQLLSGKALVDTCKAKDVLFMCFMAPIQLFGCHEALFLFFIKNRPLTMTHLLSLSLAAICFVHGLNLVHQDCLERVKKQESGDSLVSIKEAVKAADILHWTMLGSFAMQVGLFTCYGLELL